MLDGISCARLIRTQPSRPGVESIRRMPTLVACAAASLVLVLAVGLQEPASSVGLRWEPSQRKRTLPEFVFEFDRIRLDPRSGPPTDDLWHRMLLLVLAALLALAILVGAVRLIRHLTRRPPATTSARTRVDTDVPTEAEAQILKSGLSAAIRILDTERNAGNAIVMAWQGLEDAAAEAGLHRRPAETASEFTSRILYRSRGSAQSIAVLLSLYQRVRFGHHEPQAAEIAAARDSLATLVELWLADFPERRPTKAAH